MDWVPGESGGLQAASGAVQTDEASGILASIQNPFGSTVSVPHASESGPASQASLPGDDNGPILYDTPNRTSAIDDIRSGIIYAFIFTLFFTFFLILPGIRNEKFPTILCIVPSLLVASIIVISIFGTTWHVGEAPNISASYKAFSRDKIQGQLQVRIGLNSVNISLTAIKYYLLHDTDGPIVIENLATLASGPKVNAFGIRDVEPLEQLDDQQLDTRPKGTVPSDHNDGIRRRRDLSKEDHLEREDDSRPQGGWLSSGAESASSGIRVKRLNVDINYNERFYWIEPQQMRHEYHQALQRGLPYPILTVVEYLSQDEAGFNWSRQYRSAGYYTSIMLWLSFCVCIVMFCLHCATPKHGIYTMQILGILLLLTNLTYALLIPSGKRELVIPFEGQSLRFRFGWNFWLVMIGGCVSLTVGTLVSIINHFKPNCIFTTVLDVNFDRNFNECRQRVNCQDKRQKDQETISRNAQMKQNDNEGQPEAPIAFFGTGLSRRLKYPPFLNSHNTRRPSFRSARTKESTTPGTQKHGYEFYGFQTGN